MSAFPVKLLALLTALLAAGTAAFAEEKSSVGVRFTSFCVTAEGRSFRYAKNGSCLTVNGVLADEEVVDTLLRHLSSALSGENATFTPDSAPVMTVSFTAGGESGIISFYPDEADRKKVYVVSSDEDTSVTEAWRVGTILLACEGSQAAEEEEERSDTKEVR